MCFPLELPSMKEKRETFLRLFIARRLVTEPCFQRSGQMNFPRGMRPEIASRLQKQKYTGLGGFEPPTSGLEARRSVQAKPQAHATPLRYAARHT